MSDKRLTVSLPEEVWADLEAKAQAAGRSIGAHARDLFIRKYEREREQS